MLKCLDLRLPKYITVRTPTVDKAESWTSSLPFNAIEGLLRIQTARSDPLSSLPTHSQLEGLEYLNGSLTVRGGLFEKGSIHTSFMEANEFQAQDQSVGMGDTVDARSELGISKSIDFTTLKSVLPQSMTGQHILCPPETYVNVQELAVPHYRQLLFSIANNFTGLENADMKIIMHFLQKTTPRGLVQLLRSSLSFSSRAIAQSIFKGAIELGDANLIDLLLSEKSLEIEVNRVWCYIEGYKYTPIERASCLRNKELIKTLLHHGADPNRTDPVGHRYRGALEHAALHYHWSREENTSVDPEIFRMLLDKGGDISDHSLFNLIQSQDGENAGIFISANAHKKVAQWNRFEMFPKAVRFLDDSTALDIIRLVLSIDADLDSDGTTPIVQGVVNAVAKRGNVEMMEILLRSGALMTDRTLDLALDGGKMEMTEFLLRSRALITEKTLSLAIASGNHDLMRLLLDGGADVNSAFSKDSPSKTTPLAEAIRLENPEAIELLERYGPVRLDDQEQFSAAIYAASEVGNLKFVERLIQLGGQAKAKDMGIALGIAIKKGHYEAATTLIGAGADLNRYTSESKTPLIEAITRRNAGLVNLLLEAGALPKIGGSDEDNALFQAIKWGNHFIVKTLLLAGADIHNSRILTRAVERQDHVLVHILLEAGAKVNSGNNDAVEAALRNGDIGMACYLLDWGADPPDTLLLGKAMLECERFFDLLLKKHRLRYPVFQKNFGSHALVWAIRLGDQHAIRKMLGRGLDPNSPIGIEEEIEGEKRMSSPFNAASPFGYAIFNSTVEVIEMFLQTCCNPNSIVFQTLYAEDVSYRQTGFLAAIETRSLPKVRLLHQYAADVNLPAHTRIKYTPLQKAAANGSTDIVELLFRLGADVNAPAAPRDGGTALQFAAIGGNIPMACLLLNEHADVDAPASKVNGRMALEGAAEHGRLDMVQLLLNAGAGNKGKDLAQFERAKALANDGGFDYIADLLDADLQRRRQEDQSALLTDCLDDGLCTENLDQWMQDFVDGGLSTENSDGYINFDQAELSPLADF